MLRERDLQWRILFGVRFRKSNSQKLHVYVKLLRINIRLVISRFLRMVERRRSSSRRASYCRFVVLLHLDADIEKLFTSLRRYLFRARS